MAALGDVTVSIYQNWEYTYSNFREFHFKASTCREIVKAVVPSSVICIGKKLDGIQLFISRVCVCLVVSDSFVTAWTVAHGLLCRWNFPSKNTGVVSHFLLQGIFLTQGLNPCPLHLLHWLAGGFFTSLPPSVVSHFCHSVVSDSVTSWIAACPASLSITNSWGLLKLMSIELVMPSNHLPFSSSLQSFPASGSFQLSQFYGIRLPKSWSFSFNISPSNEHSGLISFRIDWLDLLAVQGTLKSLLQHHSSKASILWHSAFFHQQ